MSQCRRKCWGQHSAGLDSTPLCKGTGPADPALLGWLFFFAHDTRISLAQLSAIGSLLPLSDCSGQLRSISQLVVEQHCSCHHHSWNRNHQQLPCSGWAHDSLPTKSRQGRVWQVRRICRRKAGGTSLSLPKYMKNQPQSRLKAFTHCHTDQSFPIPHRSKASALKNVN